MLPADAWDALLDQVGLLGPSELERLTSAAALIEVTTEHRLGLGPAAALLVEAGISEDVVVIGAGAYLLLRPPEAEEETNEVPITELWDKGWTLVRRRRAQ